MVAFASLGACQLIVPGEAPEVSCASTDPTACPSGTTCDLSVGKCVAGVVPNDAGEDADAPAPRDGGKEAEGAVDTGGLGMTCVVDSECNSGLCGTSTVLTTSIISAADKPICTTTCCTSEDCPTSFVCFNGGTGGSYCVPSSKADRSPPPTGGGSAGAVCGENEDCRSGLCDEGRCIDTCCLASDCAAGTTCRVKNVEVPAPGHFIWACAAPNPDSLDAGPDSACSLQADCQNDNCVGFPKRCTPSCCTAAQCAEQGFTTSACAYGRTGNDQLKLCTPPGSGGAALGTDCADDRDCTSRLCDPELRKCAQVCCTDDDCPDESAGCAPSKSGTPFLRCVP
jgi:hypothetical protein